MGRPTVPLGRALVALLVVVPAVARADRAGDLQALRRGVEAFQDGRYEEAAATLPRLPDAQPLRVEDYRRSLLAQSLLLTGDAARALPMFQALAAAGGAFAPESAWRAADCLYELGKLADAGKAYTKLLTAKTPGGEPAVARFHLAEIAAAQKKKADAARLLRELYLAEPQHPLAEGVPARLQELEGRAPVFSVKERVRRAELLTEARHWDRAMAELALLPATLPPAERDLVDYWTGTTLYKMRRQYERAGRLLLGVHERMGSRRVEAMFHGARALSRADKDDEAIVWYRKLVAQHPTSVWAAEAQYLAGWLDYNKGRYAESQPDLDKLLDKYGDSKFATDALWFLGFGRWLLGKPAEALPYFSKLADRSGELTGGKGRYWKARALAATGKDAEAIAIWRALPSSYPLSHYAELARMQLATRKIEVGPFGDTPPSGSAPKLGAIDPTVANDAAIGRVDELLEAGLPTAASDELRRAEAALRKRFGARALPVLFDRYHKAGNFQRPYLLAESIGARALDLPPEGDARAWWELAHPLAYRALVERWQDLGKNPPYWLYTIMKKESGFNVHDASYADALGLLQMIPPTTRRVARALGIEYSDDLLYDPEGNIRTGSWYIGHLVQKFRGQLPLAAGAYNGGPRAMIRWTKLYGGRPLDEFVELVAYMQTREYIKKVVGIYAHYLWLYDKQSIELPAVVSGDYLADDGIDY